MKRSWWRGSFAGMLAALPLLLMLSASPPVQAQVEVQGRAQVAVKGGLLSSVTDNERRLVRKAALIDAWKNYLNDPAIASQARLRALEQHQKEIEADIEQFMSRVEYLAERFDKETKMLTVAVAVTINDERVSAFLSKHSTAGKQASGSGSGFAVLFLQRAATTNKTVTERREQKQETSATATTEGDDDSVSTTSRNSATSESSATAVRDSTKFQVDQGAGDASASLNERMGQAGFETTDFKDVADACGNPTLYEEAVDGFARTGNVTNVNDMAQFIKRCGKELGESFKFFATAEAEALAPRIERGEQIVRVNIRVRVTNIERAIPRTISNTQFQLDGNGPDSISATRDAMRRTGAQVARVIIDMLNQKNQN